jgi:arylsulfatase A-like enzyme
VIRLKRFAISSLFAVLASGLMVPGISASDISRPTNILLIVTDDQRWDELGLVQREQGSTARFPFLETPRLDALAAQGMRFRNAFVTTSLCSPSRSAILTGQYNHTNGIIDNSTPFSPRPTWATALQATGYTTAYFGKWHHGEEQWERPGFDYIATFRGQGLYNGTTFKINNEWFNTKTKGYVDSRTVDFAIEFLEDQEDEPFAMMVGFKAVHQPFTPMDEHAEKYASNVITPPPNWNATAPWKNRGPLAIPRRPRNSPVWMDILRTVDGVDKNVGRLLDALDELDLADNTLVIFTSDNGYYFGEHQLGDKRSAYEESIRVPLIVRLPGVVGAGTTSDELVLNIDLAPTILGAAGLPTPDVMNGQDFSPLYTDPVDAGASWRKEFFYEHPTLRDADFIPASEALVRKDWKYFYWPEQGIEQLFDLKADPREENDLAGNPEQAERLAEMRARFQQLKIAAK